MIYSLICCYLSVSPGVIKLWVSFCHL